MLKRMKSLLLILVVIALSCLGAQPIVAATTNLSSLTDSQLMEVLDLSVANGGIKSLKMDSETLVIESEGFTIITLPSQQIPFDMTSYTYELDIIPKVFNGGNYCGLIYGHMMSSAYTGRAQMKVKNDSHEFWCTGAASGVMATESILTSESFGVDVATHLKIVVSDADLTYYVNDIEVATSKSGGESGNLALLVTTGSTMAYDNIKVTNNKTETIVYEEDFSDRQVEAGNDEESLLLLNQLEYSILSGEVVEAKVDNDSLLLRSSAISGTTRVAMPSSMIPASIDQFSFEMDITFVDALDGVDNGLFFGYKAIDDLSYDIRFLIGAGSYASGTSNGEFARVLYEQRETLGVLGAPDSEYSSQSAALNETLKIKVVQENDKTKYYVNDIITDSATKESEIAAADLLGVYLSKGCTVKIDNIIVTNLENSDNPVIVYSQNFDNQSELNEKGQTPEPSEIIQSTIDETTLIPKDETTEAFVTTNIVTNGITESSADTSDSTSSCSCNKNVGFIGFIQIFAVLGGVATFIIRKKI